MNSSDIISIDEESVENNAIQPIDEVIETSEINNLIDVVQGITEVNDVQSLENITDSSYADEEKQMVQEVQNINNEVSIPPAEDITNVSQPINENDLVVPPVPPVGDKGNVSSVQSIEYDEVPTYAIDYTEETRLESYFDGKMLDYLAYSFLRGFIIGITAGVFKPWADCIFYEFKFHHTIYDGKRLKFVGKPTELFVERFKWLFFTAITFGIYALWIPLKKQKWIAQNTYFADEEIIPGESFFDAKLLGLIGVNLITIVLSCISFGILLPFCICYKNRWIKMHTIITRKRIIFKGRALSLFGNMIKWVFLTLITFGIYGWWVPIRKENWFAKNTFIKLREEEY